MSGQFFIGIILAAVGLFFLIKHFTARYFISASFIDSKTKLAQRVRDNGFVYAAVDITDTRNNTPLIGRFEFDAIRVITKNSDPLGHNYYFSIYDTVSNKNVYSMKLLKTIDIGDDIQLDDNIILSDIGAYEFRLRPESWPTDKLPENITISLVNGKNHNGRI